MNILMINATMRKSSTYTIGKMIIDKVAKEEDSVKELFLPKDMPEFCKGCGLCFSKSEEKCPHYLLYMKRITELIDDADLLVFTSPVFVFHVTGQMKALLDHYGYRFMVHRPEETMFKKQAIIISTAAGAGMKKTIRDIKDSLLWWGISEVHTYGVAVRGVSWDTVSGDIKTKVQANVERIAEKIKRDPNQVKSSIKTKLYFHIMRMVMKKSKFNPADVKYWEEKGWLASGRPWK